MSWTSDFDVHGRIVNLVRNRKFETHRPVIDQIRELFFDNQRRNPTSGGPEAFRRETAAQNRRKPLGIGLIFCVAISPDGRWLVTGSNDKTARLWDLKSKNPAVGSRVLKGHTDWINCVAIRPDGRWLVTGSDTTRLW